MPYEALYSKPVLYDIAFTRDIKKEVDFIYAVYKQHTQAELRAVVDLACGPGHHARLFAQRGVLAYGLDREVAMLAFAEKLASSEKVAVNWIKGELRYFQLDSPVDMAFCMFDSFAELTSNNDIIENLQTVSRNLTDSGLYMIDLPHPRDRTLMQYDPSIWSGEREGIRVEIIWGGNYPKFDFVTGVAHVEIEIRVNINGRDEIIHDATSERVLTPQEVSLLAHLSESLNVVGWYGGFDLNQALDQTASSERMIILLQKTK